MGNVVDKITPNVWLGGREAILENPPQFDVVITVITRQELENYQIEKYVKQTHPNCEWVYFDVDDVEDAPIQTLFREVHEIIQKAESENKTVLVHCAAGISRSASLVIAHLMLKHKWTFQQAHYSVKLKRPIITPNDGFVKALKELDYDNSANCDPQKGSGAPPGAGGADGGAGGAGGAGGGEGGAGGAGGGGAGGGGAGGMGP